MSAYLKERQKTILPLLDMPEAQVQFMVSTLETSRSNILFETFGPTRTTPLDADVLDIIEIKQMGDEDYVPSPYVCGPCDPHIPLLLDDTQIGRIISHVTPYIKRKWSSTRCGDEKMLRRAMLSELISVPFGRRKISMQQRKNLLLQAATRQMGGEIRAAISKQWTDDFIFGVTQIWGPGIPKDGGVIDMGRNKQLFKKLSGDGWCNPNASRMETIRAFFDHVYNESRDQRSYPNTLLVDEYTKKKFFEGVEFKDCDPCGGNYNQFVTRPRTRVVFETSRGDAERGIRQLNIQDDILGSQLEVWCIDEVRKECVYDSEGNPTGEKIDVPVIPQGSMIAFNRFNHSPVQIQGRIQNDRVDAPLDMYTQFFDCANDCDDDPKFGVKMETSPLAFNRRENTIGMLFVAPDECPPPKNIEKCVTEFACDPEGGKKALVEARESEARMANIMAEALSKQAESSKTTENLNKKGGK